MYNLRHFGIIKNTNGDTSNYSRTVSKDAVRFMFGLMRLFNPYEYQTDIRVKEIEKEAEDEGSVETEIYVTTASASDFPPGDALLVEQSAMYYRGFRYFVI